jgi:hypothetical protein
MGWDETLQDQSVPVLDQSVGGIGTAALELGKEGKKPREERESRLDSRRVKLRKRRKNIVKLRTTYSITN